VTKKKLRRAAENPKTVKKLKKGRRLGWVVSMGHEEIPGGPKEFGGQLDKESKRDWPIGG